MQGFIQYDKEIKTASDPFRQYKDISSLYGSLIGSTGSFIELKPLQAAQKPQSDPKSSVFINNFSPTSLTAGTETRLRISGSGFGNAPGPSAYVEFRNANDGGNSYFQPEASQYISWADDEIIVSVPAKAGTGTFRVRNGTSAMVSSVSLTVLYSHLNVVSSGNVFQPQLVDRNSNGGYIWRMNTKFHNNEEAKEAFIRAFETWRCETSVNWELRSPTSTDIIASDGVNIIRFDIGSELPAGVLGACYTYWSGCGFGSNMNWYVNELDIVFDDAANWNFSTSSPLINQYDFESVVLHELGHGHQLGHVINSYEIMHYAMGGGQVKRALSTSDINGGNYVVSRSTSSGACLNDPMTALKTSDCSGASVKASVSITITGGSNPACNGASLTYTASAINGGSSPSFQWRINGNDIGSNSSTFTSSSIKDGEKITCIMTSSMPGVNGSPATSNEITMFMYTKPEQPKVIPAGQDSIASSLSGAAYQWYYNNLLTSSSSKKIKPALAGNYAVRIIDNNGCTSEMSEDYLYPSVGLGENYEDFSFTVYPNPSPGTFMIKIDGIEEEAEITVTSLSGKEVYRSRFSKRNRGLNLSAYQAGVYFLQVKTGGKFAVQKIIVSDEN